jgi:hypothetical protein
LRENVVRLACLTQCDEDRIVAFVLDVVDEHWPSDGHFEIAPEMFE